MDDVVKFKFKNNEYREAVEYFKQKVNMPTETWRDLDGVMHSRAFAIAGEIRDGVLTDFRAAIDKAIEKGSTLNDFRKEYDAIASKWGKDCKLFEKSADPKYAAWRSRVIYSTNLAVAYSAGREEQMHNPDMKDVWTYAIYKTMEDDYVRDGHKAWNGVVMPINDPWWITHTPPCDWGCRCWKEPLTEEEAAAAGFKKPPDRPDLEKKLRESGWDHNPGMADRGNIKATKLLYKQLGEKYTGKGWEQMPQGGYYSNKASEPLPAVKPRIEPLKNSLSEQEFKTALNTHLNIEKGDFKQFTIKDNRGFTFTYAVDTENLAKHLSTDRSKYAGLIAETIENPQRISAEFTKSKKTGGVAIRQIFYKNFKAENGKERLVRVVFDGRTVKEIEMPAFESWTAYKTRSTSTKGAVIYERL